MARESGGDPASDRKRESKRIFLKFAVAVSTMITLGGIAAIPAAGTTISSGSSSFPRVKVAQLNDLTIGQPIAFNYPLTNEPNILVKLGTKADGGVGPDEDIVAFSSLCQHRGCTYGFQSPGTSPTCNPSYKADRPVGYCCCHGSVFDLVNKAKVISGPSPRPLPQVLLEVDSSGNVFATGMGPPTIFGHDTGSNDVSADLQGGTPVG